MARFFRYVIFLVLLTVLGIYESTRDDRAAYYLSKSFEDQLVTNLFDYSVSQIPKNYESINSKDDFWQWAQGAILPVFYPTVPASYWSGSTLVERGAGYLNSQTRLIGVPRLRQQRSSIFTCDVPSEFLSLTSECMDVDKDKESWGPGLNFTWSREVSLDGVWTWGMSGVYSGSGFVVEFPEVNKPTAAAEAAKLVGDLMNSSWIDAKTRVVFFEFAGYNANDNLFVVGTMLIEFPTSGAVIPSYYFQVNRLKRYMSQQDQVILALEIIVLLMMISHIYSEVRQLMQFKTRYLTSFYDILDSTIALLYIVIFILHIVTISWANELDFTDSAHFVFVTKASKYIDLEKDLISVLVLLAWFKLLHYFSVFKQISRLVVMIEMMVRNMFSFFILFGIVLAAFTSAEYIAYGYKDPDSFNWIFGFIARLSMSFTDRDIANGHTDPNNALATIYAIFFVLSISLILMNLIIAIMTTAYEQAKTDSGDSYWASRQYDMIVWDHRPSWHNQKIDLLLIGVGNGLKTYSTKMVVCCRCCRSNVVPDPVTY